MVTPKKKKKKTMKNCIKTVKKIGYLWAEFFWFTIGLKLAGLSVGSSEHLISFNGEYSVCTEIKANFME
jgi:hypothetical protein